MSTLQQPLTKAEFVEKCLAYQEFRKEQKAKEEKARQIRAKDVTLGYISERRLRTRSAMLAQMKSKGNMRKL